MAVPTPTPTQAFQNKCYNIIQVVGNQLKDTSSGQSKIGEYNQFYNAIFAMPNYTPTQVLAQIGTNAASILTYLASIATLLAANEVATELPIIPAYTVNSDGTVTIS